jgi:proteic killer suppression protein
VRYCEVLERVGGTDDGTSAPPRRPCIKLNNAANVADLRVPPGNRLEALRGDRAGQFSIRINDQWRICFVWNDNDAFDVEIVDYH